jgi:hypothetical protein
MNVKFNGISHKIKTADLVTVAEYLAIAKKSVVTFPDALTVYLSVTTGLKFRDILHTNIDDNTVRRLLVYIGELAPFEKFLTASVPKYFHFAGKTWQVEELDWQTYGVISYVQNVKTDNVVEQSLWGLAAILNKEHDYDATKIEKTYNELLQSNYIDIFTISAFFLQKLAVGAPKKQRFFRLRQMLLSIRIRKKSKI